jgi:ribose transport system permease protein
MAGLVNAGRMGSATLDQNAGLLLDAVACVVLGGTSLFGGEGGIGRTVIGVFTYTTLQVGLAQTYPKQLIKWLPAPESWKQSWLQSSVVTEFEFLRPFVLGVALLLALVIHGRLVKQRD